MTKARLVPQDGLRDGYRPRYSPRPARLIINDLTSSERRNQKSASRGQTVLAVAVPRKEKVAFVMHLSRMVLQFGGRQASIIPFGGSEGAKQSKKRRASESEVTFSAE